MSPEKFCVNCGAPLQADNKFCPSCGQPTDSLPEEEGERTMVEGAFAAEPPPPPPSPPSGGLRPAAMSHADDEAPRQPQRPAPPPPPPPQSGGGRSAGGVPPVGGHGGPTAPRPPMPPQEPKKGGNKTLYWVLGCGCAVIVLVIIGLIIWLVTSAGGITDRLSSAVGEVETAVPAEVTPAVRPERGELLYEDDFSDPDSGWDEFSASEQTVGYEDGSYVIRVNLPNWMTWGNAYEWFEDGIAIEVEATKIGGPDDNGFGLVFGYQDELNFYRFEIASDGYYRFGKYVDDEWIEIIPWQETDLVRQGAATNTIAVEMDGGTFTFLANGKVLGTAEDSSFTDGDVGLVAGSFDLVGVEIAFDDFRVYSLK